MFSSVIWEKSFFFFFFWPHCLACEILVLWQGVKPTPACSGSAVLTTRPPGKSQGKVLTSLYDLGPLVVKEKTLDEMRVKIFSGFGLEFCSKCFGNGTGKSFQEITVLFRKIYEVFIYQEYVFVPYRIM